MTGRVEILDVPVDVLSSSQALEAILGYARRGTNGTAKKVFFVNVHTIYEARKNPAFRQKLQQADLLLPDGSGLSLAGKLLGTPIVENLNGTDLTPKLLTLAEKHGLSVYLVGADDRVIQRCRGILQERHEELRILGARHGYLSGEHEDKIVKEIRALAPDIVLVGMGTPLQEKWIDLHKGFDAKVCLAVGGLFDFLSGEKPRAPRWMRGLGIEWLFRFFLEPQRKWKRIVIEIPWFFGLLGRTVVQRLASGPLKEKDPTSAHN